MERVFQCQRACWQAHVQQNGRSSPDEEDRTPADIIQSARQQYRQPRASVDVGKLPHRPSAATVDQKFHQPRGSVDGGRIPRGGPTAAAPADPFAATRY